MPEWGGLRLELPRTASRRPSDERRRGPGWIGAGEIAVGALLVVVWAMLWACFIAGVVEPAAVLRDTARHPSVDVASALPPAGRGGGPGPVDTTGDAP